MNAKEIVSVTHTVTIGCNKAQHVILIELQTRPVTVAKYIRHSVKPTLSKNTNDNFFVGSVKDIAIRFPLEAVFPVKLCFVDICKPFKSMLELSKSIICIMSIMWML